MGIDVSEAVFAAAVVLAVLFGRRLYKRYRG